MPLLPALRPAFVTAALVAAGLCAALPAQAQTPAPEPGLGAVASQSFRCADGAARPYTVPADVTEVFLDVRGAPGAEAENGAGGTGGAGARVLTPLAVSPGDVLTVTVGCAGAGTKGGQGWTHGGDGDSDSGTLSANGGGGGGSSAVEPPGGDPPVVAGGGGGGGGNSVSTSGRLGGAGGAGGLDGTPGSPGVVGLYDGTNPGDDPGGCAGCIAGGDGQDGVTPFPLPKWGGGGGGGAGVRGGGGGTTEAYTPIVTEPWPYDNAGGGGGGASLTPPGALVLANPGQGLVTIYATAVTVETATCADGLRTVTVPDEANTVVVAATGGSGFGPPGLHDGGASGDGGLGASIESTGPVEPVGQVSVQAGGAATAGLPGGGWSTGGPRGRGADVGADGGPGGGASALWDATSGDTLLVAAGGGGGGAGGLLNDGADGSDGGAPTAYRGGDSADNSGGCTATACGNGASDGEAGHDAADIAIGASGGGGGGAGWLGGGGGHAADRTGSGEGAGGGAGGDSYVAPGALAWGYGVASTPGDGAVTVLLIDDTTPTTVAAASGSGQSAEVSTAFAQPLVARVTDRSGQPVEGVEVTFTVPDGLAAGTFPGGAASVTVATAPDGTATAPALTANDVGGRWDVIASLAAGGPEAQFALTNAVQATRMSLTSSAGTTVPGASVRYTATVQGPDGGPVSCADCQVLFVYYDDGREVQIGQVAVGADGRAVSPEASFTFDTVVSAFFAGTGYAQSSRNLAQVVLPFTPSTDPATIPYDTPFTLTLTPTEAVDTPVTIRDAGGGTVCTIDLASARSCDVPARPGSAAGTETWTAAIGTEIAPFPVTFTVQTPSGATLTPSTATPAAGTPFTVAAQVLPASGAGPVAAGTAQLLVDGAPSGAPVAVDAQGGVTFTGVVLPTGGAHTLAVAYAGATGRYTPLTSATITVQASLVTAGIALVSSNNPVPAGTTVTLTATVTVPAGTAPCTPTSTTCRVVFLGSDGTFYGDVPLTASWTASVPVSWASAGKYPVTAQFLGGPQFANQPATTLDQAVGPPPGPGGTPQPRGLAITSGKPAAAVRMKPYRHRITTSDTVRPRMRVVAGALPPGLTLNRASGHIAGVPRRAGRFRFTVEARRATGETTRAAYVITVRPAKGTSRRR